AVYDRGVALTASGVYPGLAALRAATLASGNYAGCLSPAYVRLGSRPAGQITVDATEGTSSADRSAAWIARRILEAQGSVAVDGRGVARAASGIYPQLAARRAASLASGNCAVGLSPASVRLGARPAGQITLDATEGTSSADRSAASIARRSLEAQGFVAGDDF